MRDAAGRRLEEDVEASMRRTLEEQKDPEKRAEMVRLMASGDQEKRDALLAQTEGNDVDQEKLDALLADGDDEYDIRQETKIVPGKL